MKEKEEEADEMELGKDEAKVFRGVVARLNFLSLDIQTYSSRSKLLVAKWLNRG